MAEAAIAEFKPIAIEEEMRKSYLDYAMSVIVARALPDVRDGLKPVHRRILYAMHESGALFNRPYRKSARIVGEVMGKYHPHGDSAIYDALVRMAQDFSMEVPLIDGQGNFGSMDGDAPAAMRYTESRLAKISHSLLEDIDKDTVEWQDNYDGSEKEPIVIPARFPNLLVNGAGGIAVGMATTVLTHNLGEVIDATNLLIDNPETTIDEILRVLPGPDFPTGGIIMGRSGIHSAMHTGRGSVVVRGRATIEDGANGKETIIITEIPYQVNKARLVERIAELVREKRIEGITDLRDESDKSGVRVVIEVRKDAQADIILNQLYKFTPLQTSFGANMLALDRGRPALMNVKEILNCFIEFRQEVITRRTMFELSKARQKAHILIGLAIAVGNIDEVIALIRGSADPHEARAKLLEKSWPANDIAPLLALVDDIQNKLENGKCKLTDAQAQAILDMKLQRLTGLERGKIDEELQGLSGEIKDFLSILSDRNRILTILRDELRVIKEEYAEPRHTSIEDGEFDEDIEDLIPREDMVVIVTQGGYIKRVPLAVYRAQRRGGKGRSGMSMKDEDATTELFIANTHTPVLFFSTGGKVYQLKVYKLPMGNPQSKGRALVNIFPLGEGETINQVMPMPEDQDKWDQMHVMFATSQGGVRRNELAEFKRVMANGKIAMNLEGGEKLIGVRACTDNDHILLAARSGKCVRFPVSDVRVFKSRSSTGVRGMRLADKDEVISMTVLDGAEIDIETRETYLKIDVDQRQAIATHLQKEEKAEAEKLAKDSGSPLNADVIFKLAAREEFILTLTENGYGKRSSAYEYRLTSRGGSGIVNIITSERNGEVVTSMPVKPTDHIMLITNKGTLIRTHVRDIRIAGRSTQGVTIFRVGDGEKVVSCAHIADAEGSEEEQAVMEGEAGAELVAEQAGVSEQAE